MKMYALKKTMEEEEEEEEEEGERSVRYSGKGWKRGKLLGEGGFGRVNLAHFSTKPMPKFHGMPAVTAVKSCPMHSSKELLNEKNTLKLFQNCPFIVQSLGHDVTYDRSNQNDNELVLNLFLEYANGGTLWDLVSSSSSGLSELEVRGFTKSILGAIHRVHEEGLVHCDIKLKNILLFKRANNGLVAKLSDFGLAHHVDKSRVGFICGTRTYFSPEVQSLGVQDQPADIWALGCVVYYMLIGNNNNRSTTNHHTRVFSDSAKDFVVKCLEKDPNKRATAEMLMSHPFITGQARQRRSVFSCWPMAFKGNDDAIEVTL